MKAPPHLIEHEEVELESSPLLTSVQSITRYSSGYQRRKVNANLATKPLIYENYLHVRSASAKGLQSHGLDQRPIP